jgi:DNA-binding NarL/FixJ family response regulator
MRPDLPPTIRVVIADDDASVRRAVSDVLEEEGFDVVGRGIDGHEAVTLALSLSPDVVLLDVRMPNLDGIQAARQIRPVNPHVRMVMLSAYEDSTLLQEAREIGATFLSKGCALQDLVDAIMGIRPGGSPLASAA